MSTLILKLNAAGDVVRTTPLLRVLEGPVAWITAKRNLPLIERVHENLTCLSWEDRAQVLESNYDLLINLEDDMQVAEFANRIRCLRRFGAIVDEHGELGYTDEAKGWFDLSLISRFGRRRADELKLQNRRTYQDLIFEGLGLEFREERYLLPRPIGTSLKGDVAIASVSGPVWPMKHWAFYSELKEALESSGLTVSVLPQRPSVLEHLGDIANHRCVVGGDSLPMHLALGLGMGSVAIFNCTSPWEICDYGIQTKLVSPLIDQYFYRRDSAVHATRAISLQTVLAATLDRLTRNP